MADSVMPKIIEEDNLEELSEKDKLKRKIS